MDRRYNPCKVKH